jgi:hypothetical protein
MKIYLTKTSQCLLFLLVFVISGLAQNNNSLIEQQKLKREAQIFYNSIVDKKNEGKDLETAYEMSEQYLSKYGKLNLSDPSVGKLNDKITAWMIEYEQKTSKQALQWINKNLDEFGNFSFKKDDNARYIQTIGSALFLSCDDISWRRELELQDKRLVGKSFGETEYIKLNIFNLDSSAINVQQISNTYTSNLPLYGLVLKSAEGKPALKIRTNNVYDEIQTYSILFQDKDIAPRMQNAFVKAIKYCTIIRQREKANEPF